MLLSSVSNIIRTCDIWIFNKLEALVTFMWESLIYRTLHVYEIFINHKKTDLCEAVSEFQTKTPKIVCGLEKMQLWRMKITLSFKKYAVWDMTLNELDVFRNTNYVFYW